MPQELEFSIMAESPANIQPLLDQFEAEHRIRVRLRLLTWDIAWSDLVKVALYGDGPDVSDQETAVTITGPWLFAAVSHWKRRHSPRTRSGNWRLPASAPGAPSPSPVRGG